jgi:hypothetical protein
MENSGVRFADFECVLLRLGFQRKATVGPQHFYEHHTEEDTYILLPPYTQEEIVRPLHLLAARRLIAERSIVDESAFDRMLADAAQDADCTHEETTDAVMQTA